MDDLRGTSGRTDGIDATVRSARLAFATGQLGAARRNQSVTVMMRPSRLANWQGRTRDACRQTWAQRDDPMTTSRDMSRVIRTLEERR